MRTLLLVMEVDFPFISMMPVESKSFSLERTKSTSLTGNGNHDKKRPVDANLIFGGVANFSMLQRIYFLNAWRMFSPNSDLGQLYV